jgi:hypothetical protein
VVDIERRLTHLNQAILLLTYREHCDQRQVSDATCVSVRSPRPPVTPTLRAPAANNNCHRPFHFRILS